MANNKSKPKARPYDVCVATAGFPGTDGFVQQSTRVGKMWIKESGALFSTIDFDIAIPTEVIEAIIAQTKEGVPITKSRFVSASLAVFNPKSAE